MKIMKFEDILIWQKAKLLTLDCYRITKNLKDYSFKDQMQRACVSVMNNIAEGYERQTTKEFQQFLYIARGSCGEIRSMLYLALDLKYISQNEFNDLYSKSIEISKMIFGLIKKINSKS